VKTEFFDRAVCDNGAITYFNKYWESADVVRKALRDLGKGKDVSVLGFSVRAQVLLTKLLPHRLVMRIWLKQQGH
jgi:short-subunit dehydrogenase